MFQESCIQSYAKHMKFGSRNYKQISTIQPKYNKVIPEWNSVLSFFSQNKFQRRNADNGAKMKKLELGEGSQWKQEFPKNKN